MRVRVVKSARQGNAFWAGVYDLDKKKGLGVIELSTASVAEEYQWYDVATWIPDKQHLIWIGPGRFDDNSGQSAIEALYVDQFELIRVN